MPKVSVIVPVYNVANYVGECLDSILKQSLRDIEVLCIDDASTDRSYDVLLEYAQKDQRIVILRNETNSGAGISRNKGIEKANGTYCVFVDPDDLCCNSAFILLYDAAKKYGVDIVRGNFQTYNMTTSTFGKEFWCAKEIEVHEESVGYVVDTPQLWVPNLHVIYMFKREFLIKNHIYYSCYRVGEDLTFLAKCMASVGKVACIPVTVYTYRIKHKERRWTREKYRHYVLAIIETTNILLQAGLQVQAQLFFVTASCQFFYQDGWDTLHAEDKVDLFFRIAHLYYMIDLKAMQQDAFLHYAKVLPIKRIEGFFSQMAHMGFEGICNGFTKNTCHKATPIPASQNEPCAKCQMFVRYIDTIYSGFEWKLAAFIGKFTNKWKC